MNYSKQIIVLFILSLLCGHQVRAQRPFVINTWRFPTATASAWKTLNTPNRNAIDALVDGCSTCEREQCETTVGYGGSPDENGETTLDAMIMDGVTMNVGAVAALRNIKDAIAVARLVLERTQHTMLVGNQATAFAVQMGFREETLSTAHSKLIWKRWRKANCQPNFWAHVAPNPSTACGPYQPLTANTIDEPANSITNHFDNFNHDTIGMIAIDVNGKIAAGTSTNGAKHKIPGRVGDSPIPGSGAYADATIGAAAATGDGDVMMRFMPSLLALEYMRDGLSPSDAGTKALQRIAQYHPKFFGAIIVVHKNGQFAAACHGMEYFPYAYASNDTNGEVVIKRVDCIRSKSN